MQKTLLERDLKRVWHPCMQMKDFENLPLIQIQRAKGAYIYDTDGNSYLDAISSWWVNLFGHSHPYINEAITKQLENFAHVMTANFTHEPMIRLSERLCSLTGNTLTRCFYASDGSSAVEAALKMAFQYHKNSGRVKKRYACLANSYHGETIGALSNSDTGLYKETFKEILHTPIILPTPKDQGEKEAKKAAAEAGKLLLAEKDNICALIAEPLVQCAGGMKMHSPLFIKELRTLCDSFDIIYIADEIATGFGRTGTMFACEKAEVWPDIMCLSKGITGGYLPLSVVMCSEKIYEAFYDDFDSKKAFLHSHSYSGNALAIAAANGVLDIFEKESTLSSNLPKIELIRQELKTVTQYDSVIDARSCGQIAAVEFKTLPERRIGLEIFKHALTKGIFIRPLGNVAYIMLPYCCEEEEICRCVELLKDVATKIDTNATLS